MAKHPHNYIPPFERAEPNPYKRSAKQGMLPGTPVYVGDNAPLKPTLHAFVYDEDSFAEKTLESLDDLHGLGWHIDGTGEGQLLWLNVDGLGDTGVLTEIGTRFDISVLVIEDILNTEQRTKLDDFEKHLFIVMKMLELHNGHPHGPKNSKRESHPVHGKNIQVTSEQVSFILGHNFLLTFLEDPGDVFEHVRQQLRENKGKIRKSGPDYLMYSLMDVIVDRYFILIEHFGEHLEHLSDVLLRNPTPGTLRTIHRLRQETLTLRRSLWPLREVLGHLQRDESPLIQQGTKIYLRDVYDHAIEVIDTIETNRDVLSGMADMYLSASSYQLNVVMKVLTVISTIFIPLTFITSVYGMNFEFMPELHNPSAYPIVWLLMLTIAASMLYFFYKKRWLS